jgi:hypothetical protein
MEEQPKINSRPNEKMKMLRESVVLGEGADLKRLGDWQELAKVLDETKVSLDRLKETLSLDGKRIAWWRRIAKGQGLAPRKIKP